MQTTLDNTIGTSVAQKVAQMSEYFDASHFVADNRILAYDSAITDPFNEHITIHQGDLRPEREGVLREHITAQMQLSYPPIHGSDARNAVVNALWAHMPRDASASTIVPQSDKQPLPSDPKQAPFSHYMNGEPLPQYYSPQESYALRDAISTYIMLENYLTSQGQAGQLEAAVTAYTKDNKTPPNLAQIGDMLQPITGLTGVQLTQEVARGGVVGAAQMLGHDQHYLDDVTALTNHIMWKDFPLNDVVNWKFGRMQPGMEQASPEQKIQTGLQARINYSVDMFRQIAQDPNIQPPDLAEELHLASTFNHLPPVLSALFFEMNGTVIYTHQPNLSKVLDKFYSGFSELAYSDHDQDDALNPIFISGRPGLAESKRVFVHEINHMMFPEQLSAEEAAYGDRLLQMDQRRISELQKIVVEYEKATALGDSEAEFDAITKLHQFKAPNGLSFVDAKDVRTSMSTFSEMVNEASQFLLMNSPTYDDIPTYAEPVTRFKEIIPRYAEMRYVDYNDQRDLMAFIAPGVTEMYDTIYLPHIQRQLESVVSKHGSRTDELQQEQAVQALENAFTSKNQSPESIEYAARYEPHTMVTQGRDEGLLSLPNHLYI